MAIPTKLNQLADYIHRLRLAADQHTPGPGSLANLVGGPLMYALQGAAQPDVLNNHKPAMVPSPAPSPAPSATPAAPSAPQLPSWVDGRSFGAGIPTPPAPQASPPTQPASVPMPQARPAEADASQPAPTPDMGFFARNAAMMRDPGTGAFIDPMGAAQAVRGPDLINKMMAYLHNKDTG